MSTLSTVLAFILLFGALVFFHELGHFIFAKRSGILCREFAIGFGPKILAFNKNETTYTIRLLPLGGYVRMAGEDPELIELKPGLRVGLILDKNEVVKKIIINRKEKYPDARIIEIEQADIEKDLFITGFEEEEEERIKSYKIDEKAVLVENGIESQIAPIDRQFSSKSLLARTLTIFAGPLFNFILAIVVFILLGFIQGVPSNEPMLGEITKDGSAMKAGLKQGDIVHSIDDAEVSTWLDIVEIIQENPGDPLTFHIERDDKRMDIQVTPQNIEGEGKIGVYQPMNKSFDQAFVYGFTETWFWTKQIFVILGDLVTGGFTIDAFSGPVGIYASTEAVAQSGIFNLFRWGALLSINLGIMNLLPIPALDGGRLLFFGIEALRGKPIDKNKEGFVHFIGFALLMLLMIVVTWNDIRRFFL
ncbi:RIP metalloprotease RseP [Caldifermentibacillus hisashii]|uniref:RIP metalloprotease RseP n=1 Tax=Caldifermentibacillus hisashii TaxID=996558 RepID=UPI001C101B3C|nr:RIP metalloprotease RseP [Caldifermentibacillus hisashii]MBU5341088.1 RIP metalloprotease RseP [Caldifermentibacillus hisashii]